jgi:hypothetical protein
VEQLRGELQQVLDGRRGHSLLGGVVAQEGSRGAGENIEEEIEEIVCDGVCATAEHLRRQLAELQLDHQRQSELNFDGQGRQAAEEGFSMQEREQGECNGGAWRNCGGRCDSAERLRHQVLSPSLEPSPFSFSPSSSPFPLPPPPPPAPLSLSLKAIAAWGEDEELDVRCRDAAHTWPCALGAKDSPAESFCWAVLLRAFCSPALPLQVRPGRREVQVVSSEAGAAIVCKPLL